MNVQGKEGTCNDCTSHIYGKGSFPTINCALNWQSGKVGEHDGREQFKKTILNSQSLSVFSIAPRKNPRSKTG